MDLDIKLKFNFNKRNRYKNICSIEGCNNNACGKYCNKHYHQIKRYGNIKTRTRFDKNEIIINDNIAKILLYNNNCNVIDYTIIDAEDINNIDLIKLDIIYNIQWKECSCLKGIRLEDVTEELEDKAYEEMRHN